MIAYSPVTAAPLGLPDDRIGRLWHYWNRGNRSVLHSHPEHELNLTLRGTGQYLINGRRANLDAGTLLWIRGGEDHMLLNKSADLEMWIAIIRPNSFPVELRPRPAIPPEMLRDKPLCRHITPRPMQQLKSLFKELADLWEAPELFNAGLLYALLRAWDFHGKAENSLSGAVLHPGVQKALELIRDETDPIPVSALARRAGLSPSRFNEVFKRDTGMTPVELRTRHRIERFLQIYDSGQGTMLQAAYEAGFGSYPQFFRSFTQIMGCSPRALYKETLQSAAAGAV